MLKLEYFIKKKYNISFLQLIDNNDTTMILQIKLLAIDRLILKIYPNYIQIIHYIMAKDKVII